MVELENLYLIRNGNGTVDTMVCNDLRMVEWAATAAGCTRGGIQELTQVPAYTKIDLDSTELKFAYRTSQN